MKNLKTIFLLCSECLLFSIASGCAINLWYSENFPVLKRDIQYAAPTPIARELKYVYATGTIINNKPNLLITSNLTDASELKVRAIDGWTNITGIQFDDSNQKRIVTTSGSTAKVMLPHSDVTNDAVTARLTKAAESKVAEARAASARGDHLQARSLSDQAIINEQMAQFNQSMNSSIQMMQSFASAYAALAELGKAMHRASGQYLADWVKTHTGAIGESASPGSILHIDFLHALKGSSFQLSSDGELIVAASLELGNGERLSAARGIKIVLSKGSEAPPPGYVSKDEVPFTDAEAREIDGGDASVPPYLHQFAVLIRATIKDLYNQLKESQLER